MSLGTTTLSCALWGAVSLSIGVSTQAPVRNSTTQTAEGNGVVIGRVIDAAGGGPIADAVVSVNTEVGSEFPSSSGNLDKTGSIPQRRYLVDHQGRFVLRELPGGEIRIEATAQGYVPGKLGQSRPGGPARALTLGEDERRDGIIIRLWKFGVISGRVVDDVGEPAIGVSVDVLSRVLTYGRPRFSLVTRETTDDRGMYRAGMVPPGDFVVALPQKQVTMPLTGPQDWRSGPGSRTGPPNQHGLRIDEFIWQTTAAFGGWAVAPPPAKEGHLLAFPTTFYSGTSAVGQATVITLDPGEERTSVDFQLRPVLTVRVSGTVLSSDGPVRGAEVCLFPANAEKFGIGVGFEAAITSTDADGAFTFLGVPQGQYTLRALRLPLRENPTPPEIGNSSGRPTGLASQLLAGETAVDIATGDVGGLSVAVRPGLTISGKVLFDGESPLPSEGQLRSMSVSLSPVDGAIGLPARPTATGSLTTQTQAFRTAGYPPGEYSLSLVGLAAPAWVLRSIVVDGRELTGTLLLTERDLVDAVVTLTDKVGEVTGTVSTNDGKVSESATVIIFSADRRVWNQAALSSKKPRVAPASTAGVYNVNGLIAGEYFIAALSDADVRESQDSSFLEAVSRVATRISLSSGEKKSYNLQLARIR